MRDWFKYDYGYINIDDAHIYFTNTGNWSETKELKEKGIQKSRAFRRFRIQLFISIIFSLVAFSFLKKLSINEIGSSAISGIPIAVFLMYRYLKPELGATFKLPISKLLKVEVIRNDVVLHFIDAHGKADEQLISKPQEKGILLLNEISNNTFKNSEE